MHKRFLQAGALLSALAVILGAFGAHALKQLLTDKALATFETGVKYQFYHAIALLLTGILYKEFNNIYLRRAGVFFGCGIFLFSGSLYLLSFLQLSDTTNFRWIGAVTPLGGICFIAGWVLLAIGVSKKV